MFGRGKFAGDVGREDMEETLHWSKRNYKIWSGVTGAHLGRVRNLHTWEKRIESVAGLGRH